ncbi:MAG: hypothetical protein ACLP1X_32520 [Polyangiaceae bacterium]
MKFVVALAALAAVGAVSAPRSASAAPPEPALMARLAEYAARLDSMRTHASYGIEGQLETLDRSGKPDSVKAMTAHVDADGKTAKLNVIKYTEDGEDKTDEARKKARESDEKRKKDNKKRVRIPLLATEQPRYVFDQLEVDPTDSSRVKISFVPKDPEQDTIEGSAWVDAKTGSLISAGFKLSKTSMFVDYVHFTVEFGETTPLGSAVSTVLVEGQGGILFFRKRFRGTAKVTGYTIVP